MMKPKFLSTMLIAALGIGLSNNPALSCSRVLLNAGEDHVVGRTMDLYMPDNPKIIAYPRGISRSGAISGNAAKWISTYGSVVVNSLDLATSDGINEKGLVANLLYLHDSKYEPRDSRPGVANAMVIQYLLDTSATVQDALEAIKKVQIVSVTAEGREWPLHVSVSDANGDSAVIEFINGVMVIHQGKETAVMTNEPPLDWQLNNLKNYKYFGGTQALPGDIDPVSRFARASAFLKTLPTPKTTQDALAGVFSILKTVSVPHGAHNTSSAADSEDTWPTLWSTLADSRHKHYYFHAETSPNMFWVDLNNLDFSESAPVRSISAQDPSLYGEISAKLKSTTIKN